MVVFGYLRVSTEKQFISNYRDEILRYANEHKLGCVEWIQETISGRKKWENRLLGKVFNETMKKGDIILTAEFSRIGRDMLNSMNFIAKAKEREIKVISINGDIPQELNSNALLILAMTAWKNQSEREMISSRTRVGIRAARERGKQIGRVKDSNKLEKDMNNVKSIKDDLTNGLKKKAICKKYHVTSPTLKKFLNKYNIEKEVKEEVV